MKAMTLCLLAVVTSGQATAQDEAAKPYTDPEVYAIYSEVLQFLNQSEFKSVRMIAINHHTVTYQTMCGRPSMQYEAVVGPAIADYERENHVQRGLLPRFTLDKDYELIWVDKPSATYTVDTTAMGLDQKPVTVVPWGTSRATSWSP